MRPRQLIRLALVFICASACKRQDNPPSVADNSMLFGSASPEAREALALRVDYRLTDENFSQWEAAQRNLDRLPVNAIPMATSAPGNAIDRAVARLESSPRARTAIESTGLTVRDFVRQTIALAQAADAAENPRSASAALVPPENFRFVNRYRQRLRPSRSRVASVNANSATDTPIDTLGSEWSGADSSAQRSIQTEQPSAPDSGSSPSRPDPPIPTDTATDSTTDDG